MSKKSTGNTLRKIQIGLVKNELVFMVNRIDLGKINNSVKKRYFDKKQK